jgi:cyclic-di-GMP phosphodiesterase TipF (flagellum assembly factor)
MLRLGAVFIAICMVLIAGSIGAVLFLVAGLSIMEATVVAVVVLTGLGLYNAVSNRLRDRSHVGGQIADLSRATADLSRQVAELSRRVAVIEGHGESASDKARTMIAPLSAELGELGTLVKELAESVALHEVAIAAGKLEQAQGEADEKEAASLSDLGEPEAVNGAQKGELAGMGRDAAQAVVRSAVEAGRVDLYLQPIVTLPQRKVRYYEALTRLRTEEGDTVLPSEFLEPAAASGLLPRIDHLLLFRSVQVVRRLLLKNRDIGLFCNLSTSTLNDPQLFPQLAEFMGANRALAPALVLEFKQEAWRSMGPLEQEGISGLREMGFRFCMDQITDLRIEPKELAERGVRFVKVSAPMLLGRTAPSGDIHPADLSDLLGRFGISLIADRIENESQVVDLLDYDLRFGQGFLFSPPRPVRAEALQGAADAELANVAAETPRPAAAGGGGR